MNRGYGRAAGSVLGGSLTAGWLIVIGHRPWRVGGELEGRCDEAAAVNIFHAAVAERTRKSTFHAHTHAHGTNSSAHLLKSYAHPLIASNGRIRSR